MGKISSQPTALPDGVRYYLLRGSIMVPLVPVDQLPFQLQGIPCQLSHRQMSDENWKLLQETAHASTPLSVQAPNDLFLSKSAPVSKPHFLAPDHCVRMETTNAIAKPRQPDSRSRSAQSDETISVSPRTPKIGSMQYSSLPDSIASVYKSDAQRFGYRLPYPSGIEPDQSKKQFCTHWIKTGECAFLSVGCKYRHEMPMIDKLRELGFTQVPRWWKEKSAIVTREPTWLQRRLASGSESDDPSEDISPLHMFPDPSTFGSRHGDKDSRHLNQSERRVLQEDMIHEQATDLRPVVTRPIPIPQNRFRRESQPSDLLIDFDDTPTSPPSPQLSNRSSTSGSSCSIQIPSGQLFKPQYSPYNERSAPTSTNSSTCPSFINERHEQEDKKCQKITSRNQSTPQVPKSEELSLPINTHNKRKDTRRNTLGRPNASTRPISLPHQGHTAVSENFIHIPEVHENISNRVLAQLMDDEGELPEPAMRIGHGRRNAISKGRAKRGIRACMGAQGSTPGIATQ
ncbi:hypothetical protein GQ44DRAFT_727279 [Phaeosphaeriaceae sp. PMI808]|nr:hypothetical protein GQ44DRAFT_727279 [Phaeosphaeriaceae sp. PMI808]